MAARLSELHCCVFAALLVQLSCQSCFAASAMATFPLLPWLYYDRRYA